jgi:aminomethyltransferase
MTATLDLTDALADASREVADYTTVRTTAGVYPIAAPLIRITGDDRLTLLDQFLSKGSDFVEPETTRECLVLSDDGTPFVILLHLELSDESWLLPRTPVSQEALEQYVAGLDTSGDVVVEVAPAGWGAVAVEGPQAWAVAAEFVDFDISGVTLHAITSVELPGADGTPAYLARVGSTGEYGYLLLSPAPEQAHEAMLTAATAQGGGAVGAAGLARVQAEAGLAYYFQGLDGLSVNEADLAWMLGWDRVGEFRGSENLVKPTAESAKLSPLVAPAGSGIAVGATVTAGDVAVGTIVWRSPSANPDEELLFALLRSPFWVSGLELSGQVGDEAQPLRTVSLPRVIARSSHTRIG